MANRQIFQHEEDLLLNDECKLLEDDANNKTKMFKLGTLKNFIAEFVKDKIKSWEYDSLKTEGKSIIESANEIYATTQKRMVSMEEIDLVTEAGFFVDALAVKELNRKLKWKLLSDGLMGGVSVSIPSDADQIHIKANMTNNIILTIEIATIELSGNTQSYRSGYAQSANVNGMVAFGVSNTQITLTNGVLNGASVTPSWSVYYR